MSKEARRAISFRVSHVHNIVQNLDFFHGLGIRWLEIVSSTYVLMGRYNPPLSLDATIMVSKNCPTIGEHVVIIFVIH